MSTPTKESREIATKIVGNIFSPNVPNKRNILIDRIAAALEAVRAEQREADAKIVKNGVDWGGGKSWDIEKLVTAIRTQGHPAKGGFRKAIGIIDLHGEKPEDIIGEMRGHTLDDLKARIRELQAESAGRLNALNEKAEEARQNWIRAERAEQERDLARLNEESWQRQAEDCMRRENETAKERDELIDAVQAETKLPSRVLSVVIDTIQSVCESERALRRIAAAAQRLKEKREEDKRVLGGHSIDEGDEQELFDALAALAQLPAPEEAQP